MTTFDERERAFEEKFAHDEELKFKATVKTAKLLAEWAAFQIGLSPEVYSAELVNMIASGKSEDQVLEKVLKDAVNKGKQLSKEALHEKFLQLQNQARHNVINH